MSRGKKLNIFIGANIEEGWSEIKEKTPPKKTKQLLEPSKHLLIFKKEKRKGKTVTLVGEFFTPKDENMNYLKLVKKGLGCGGTYKDGWMEFQGDIQNKLKTALQDFGFRFKHS